MNPRVAIEILRCCGIPPHADFFTLTASQVCDLLTFADDYRYRKPVNANGSRGRYFYAFVLRHARRFAP